MNLYKKKKKYNVKDDKKDGEVFYAFERWRKNLKTYFFIEKNCYDLYIFKFGYSRDGTEIDNINNKHLEIMEHDEEFYNMFIKKIKSMTKKWKKKNYSKKSIEGSKWGIHCEKEQIEYESIGDYPENYYEVFRMIFEFFNAEYIMKKDEEKILNSSNIDNYNEQIQFLYGPPPFEVIKLDKDLDENMEKDINNAQDINDSISIASLDDLFCEEDKEVSDENIDKEINKIQCLYGPPPFMRKDFDDYIEKDFEDPFWKELVSKYFKEFGPVNEREKIREYNNLRIYGDIFNEFTKYLVQKNYDIKDALEIEGYTAKRISELYPKLNAISIYKIMAKLMENPENAENIIKSIKN